MSSPSTDRCLEAARAALRAINREDLIPALDQPPPQPADPWIAIPSGTPLLGTANTPTPVDAFRIARCAVTEHEWWVYCTRTGQDADPSWRDSKLPVVYVTYNDANAYAAWLTAEAHINPSMRPDWWVPGTVFRLPTEQEWEYAARGTDGRTYPWGKWDSAKCANHGLREPVDARPEGASPFGVLGMAGNVWEWTASVWRSTMKVGS